MESDSLDGDLLAAPGHLKERDPEGWRACSGWALTWDVEPGGREVVERTVDEGQAEGILSEFLQLARGEGSSPADAPRLRNDILRFAESWGPLRLCQDHGTPLPFCRSRPGRRCRSPYRPEPLLLWRRWANRAAAVLQLGRHVRGGEMGSEQDWATVMGDTVEGVRAFLNAPFYVDKLAGDHRVPEGRDELKDMPLDELQGVWNRHRVALDPGRDFWGEGWSAGEHLQMELTFWLRYGQVTPRVRWDESTGLDLQDTGHGTLGAVAHRLVCAAVGAKPRIRCYWCGTLYAPERKPRRDVDRHFCGRCRDRSVPARLRKRRQRGGQ